MTIRYIQSPDDPGAATTAIRFRASPVFLLRADLRLLSRLKRQFLSVFTPLDLCGELSETRIDDLQNLYSIFLQGLLVIIPVMSLGIGIVLVALGVVTFFPAWPVVFVVHLLVTGRCVLGISGMLNWGEKTVVSNAAAEEGRRGSRGGEGQHSREKWMFVNGICTGTYWQQKNINLLEDLFGRQILGIQNKTHGFIFDVIECVVLRCFGYVTESTRTAYEEIKQALQDPSLSKVVVIAHSQGGIILSTALDMMYADLPPSMLSKLEIYTFASAANHFNNPSYASTASQSNDESLSSSIKHVEHYCNRNDWVSKFGTVHFAVQPPENRFFGKVFISPRGGHLFNAHYLSKMFVPEYGYREAFLSQSVEIDEAVAVAREGRIASWLQTMEKGRPASVGRGRRKGSLQSPPPPPPPRASSYHGHDYGQKEDGALEEALTMRDVSRLWKYLEGRSPEPEE